MKDLFVAAHPDDIEVMIGHAASLSKNAYAIVATDGAASTVDMRGSGFCCGWQAT